MSPKGSAGAVKSAERLMNILEYLAANKRATFVQIVRDLELPNSSGHQLLQTIYQRGFIDYDATSRAYTLGIRAWEVGQAFQREHDLASIAQRHMDALVEQTLETAQLATLNGKENVYLAISETPHPMKLVSAVGSRLPAHATGVGKVLLSDLTDEELAELYGPDPELEKFTEKTVSTFEDLLAVLRRIRENGYGEDVEEYVIGVRCIAAPIRGADGRTVAALSISMPTPRFHESQLPRLKMQLTAAIAKIEGEIGAAPHSAR